MAKSSAASRKSIFQRSSRQPYTAGANTSHCSRITGADGNGCRHTLYVNRYLDSSNKTIANFNEDADVTTTTVPGGRLAAKNLTLWREGRIPFREGDREYNGVFLGWDRSHGIGSYSITLPPKPMKDWKLTSQSFLTVSIAAYDEQDQDMDEKAGVTDLTIAAEDESGVVARVPLSRFGHRVTADRRTFYEARASGSGILQKPLRASVSKYPDTIERI